MSSWRVTTRSQIRPMGPSQYISAWAPKLKHNRETINFGSGILMTSSHPETRPMPKTNIISWNQTLPISAPRKPLWKSMSAWFWRIESSGFKTQSRATTLPIKRYPYISPKPISNPGRGPAGPTRTQGGNPSARAMKIFIPPKKKKILCNQPDRKQNFQLGPILTT